MKKLGKVFVALTLTMFSHIASANAGSVQLGKRDSLYVVDNGRTYYGPGSGARGEICNLGDYNCAARQTARANSGFGRHGYGHRDHSYFVPRHFVAPPHAMRRLRPAYRYGYGVAAPVAAGFTVGAVIGARGGYAGGYVAASRVVVSPVPPDTVTYSTVPVNPAPTGGPIPTGMPDPETVYQAQLAAGNLTKVRIGCPTTGDWITLDNGECGRWRPD